MASGDLPNQSNKKREALEIMHEQLIRALRRDLCCWPRPDKDQVETIIASCMRSAGAYYKMRCSVYCITRPYHDDHCLIAYRIKGASERTIRMIEVSPYPH